MIALVICILRGSHYVIALSKAFLVFAFKICLRHQSVTPFLRSAPPPKKNAGSVPGIYISMLDPYLGDDMIQFP